MADLKISQFNNGGAVQPTDEIATNRSGVNTKVFVGTAAAKDVGTDLDQIPTNADIETYLQNNGYVQLFADSSGIDQYPAGDGSLIEGALVRVSPDDAQAGNLEDKIIAGSNVGISKIIDSSGLEQLVISSAGGGGGLPDGDYGDITVSGSGAVWTIDNDAVTTAKIDDEAVTTAKIDDEAVTTAKIDDEAVTTAKIDDEAVTPEKLDGGAATPGNSKYYGTDGAGDIGFHDLPAAASGGLIEITYYTCPTQTTTISNASPAVFGYPNSGRNAPQNGCPVVLSTTGTLPSPLVAGQVYWVVGRTGNNSNLSLTKGGAAIATTTAGSGTHSIQNAPYVKAVNNPSFVIVTTVGGTGGHSNGGTNPGGAGGGGAKKRIPYASLGDTETVTSGSAGFTTTNGGTSSFGSHCSGTGGGSVNSGIANGGIGTGGDINITGSNGLNLGSNTRVGGISAFGLSYGAAAQSAAVVDGMTGIVIVEEYR